MDVTKQPNARDAERPDLSTAPECRDEGRHLWRCGDAEPSMKYGKILKVVFRPLVLVAAAIYFVIDGVILAVLRPLLKRIAHLKLFRFIAVWIESLGPYPTLLVFLIPLILLEPVKPVSAYLIASGHFVSGVLALVLGEVLKILIVERVFRIGRPKLMTIQAFAKTYDFVIGWLTWLQALPPWQAVKRGFADFKSWMRKLKRGDGRPTRRRRHI